MYQLESEGFYLHCVFLSRAIIKPEVPAPLKVLMLPLLPPPSLPSFFTHHDFCDGARCQLVSSTCRRRSLVQASAGCEIGRLTFVHELCMHLPLVAGPTHTCTQTHVRKRRGMPRWPDTDLYGMATLCATARRGGCDTSDTPARKRCYNDLYRNSTHYYACIFKSWDSL